MIYDSVIIGTGPAGFSAALNLKIHKKNFLWFGSKAFSKKVQKAEKIYNYPGLSGVSGEEMLEAFKRQAEQMSLDINESVVTSVIPMGDYYAVAAGKDFFETKTVIFATGIAPAATVKGEEEFLGRGVSYCATCDGNLYKNKTVAVIGTNARFEHEVKYLAQIANKLYYFPLYKGQVFISDNTEVMSTRAVSVNGEKRVESLTLSDGSVLHTDGLFCLRDSVSLNILLNDLNTDNGHIVTDRNMRTNLPGCFAAGDCTGRPYQYAKAAGEGNVAAHAVIEYLAEISDGK